jgi:hypothetical protein
VSWPIAAGGGGAEDRDKVGSQGDFHEDYAHRTYDPRPLAEPADGIGSAHCHRPSRRHGHRQREDEGELGHGFGHGHQRSRQDGEWNGNSDQDQDGRCRDGDGEWPERRNDHGERNGDQEFQWDDYGSGDGYWASGDGHGERNGDQEFQWDDYGSGDGYWASGDDQGRIEDGDHATAAAVVDGCGAYLLDGEDGVDGG